MNDRKPAEVFPPGEFVLEEIEARGWAQEDLARILNKPLPTVNRIIKGKSAVTPDTAKRLAAAFGNSAQFWMNLESAWQLHNADDPTESVRSRLTIYQEAPVREMIRRKWIRDPDTPEELIEELRRHFSVGSLDELPDFRAAARSAVRGEDGTITPEQWAWM